MTALIAKRWPAARGAACREQSRALLRMREQAMGAVQVKHAAPIAAIHQAMTPAGLLAAAATWARALPAAATLTRPAGRGAVVPRRQGRRYCWFMVLLAAGDVWVKDFTPACEVGNIKALVEQLYH
ncbi:hypothetical protein ACX800_13330 [Paenarthrobacter nitroguajacolicus]|uniref:hypothetical protein n=1 Tax=Paenarthrobacter nitroguajacolicus TaxID=211146 RepID=UPI003D23D1EC